MTMLDVYIGDLKDPDFQWEDGNWNGNIPQRISPFFTQAGKVGRDIISGIQAGTLQGKQTDWGSYVAKLYPHEMLEFLSPYYEEEERIQIELYLMQLEPMEQYGLVSAEE